MKNLLKIEEAAMFALGVLAFAALKLPWWWFAPLILAPDLSALGYLAEARAGAFTYNLAHHKGVAIAFYLLGVWAHSVPLLLAGIIAFAIRVPIVFSVSASNTLIRSTTHTWVQSARLSERIRHNRL